jgi:hypothetical protein
MATDNFDRDNAETLGSPWLNHGSTWGIRSNAAALIANNGLSIATRRDVAAANVTVKFKVTVIGSGNTRVVVRANAAGTHWIECVFAAAGSYVTVNEVTNGSGTTVGGFPGLPNSLQAGETIEVAANGSTIELYRTTTGGTRALIHTVTSTFNQTEVGVGFGCFNDTAVRFDDFEATAIGGGGASVAPLAQRHYRNRRV